MYGKLKSQTWGGNFARKSLENVNQSYFTLEVFPPKQASGQDNG